MNKENIEYFSTALMYNTAHNNNCNHTLPPQHTYNDDMKWKRYGNNRKKNNNE